MKQTITIGTDTLLKMARQLLDRNEITLEQYAKMQRQNNALPQEIRKDTLEIIAEQRYDLQ
jgi:hypothetical protein